MLFRLLKQELCQASLDTIEQQTPGFKAKWTRPHVLSISKVPVCASTYLSESQARTLPFWGWCGGMRERKLGSILIKQQFNKAQDYCIDSLVTT